MKFWIEGEGQALAFDEAVAGTDEVHWGFSLVVLPSFLPLFMLIVISFILLADAALGCSDLCCWYWRGWDLFDKHEGHDVYCW